MAQSHRCHKRCAETLIELHLASRFCNHHRVMVNTITNLFGRSFVTASAIAMACTLAKAQDAKSSAQYNTQSNILYRTGDNLTDYMKERCRLDVYHPVDKEGYPTIVWFHGGGLKGGRRFVPEALKEKDVAIVAVNYRLHPKVKSPAYIRDAAAAVAWTIKNIAKYGGSPRRIFVSGHSAGGYLTSMIGLDDRWLAGHGIDAGQLAGLIPYSGHTITHFTVRAERGIDGKQPIIDEMARLYHVRKDCPPLLLITGDRELEKLGRY